MSVDVIAYFLRLLYGDALSEDFVSLWRKQDGRSEHLKSARQAASVAYIWNRDEHEVYFGVGLRSADLGTGKRGAKVDVAALPGLWVDIDIAGPAHQAANLPTTIDEALTLLEGLPDPTAVVDSGHGLHVYWLFDSLLRDVVLGERLCAALQDRVIDAAAARGWHVDRTSDAARVLRLPGTTNRKIPHEPRHVYLMDAGGPRYSVPQLVEALGVRPRRPDRAPAGGERALPPPAVRASLPLEDVRKAIVSHADEEVRRAAAGESFAPAGERDAAMQRVCSKIAFLAPGNAPAELAELLRPSFEVWAAEPGALLTADMEVEKAVDKFQRAQREILQKMGAEEAEREAFKSALWPEKQERVENFERWAQERGRSRAQLLRELVIRHERALYVFVRGAYKRPISPDVFRYSMYRDLADAPIEWTKVNAKGNEVLRTAEEILASVCTVARETQADLALQSSWYDAEAEVFHEAACPLRPLQAREHAEVGRWLQHFVAPDELELLQDWIAVLPDLTRQSTALYLLGPKSSGKTLLAHGLARLWTEGAPADAARVLADFNDELLRCPLVAADEHLPQKFAHENLSAKIRALLGSSSRTLNRKYLATASLKGAVRLIISTNNPDLLNVGDEDVTNADIAAIASRFLHLTVLESAVSYLDKIGGPPVLNNWIEHDMIAEHALWLRQQRPNAIASSKRFVIDSPITSLHRSLAIQGKTASLVAQWLVGFLHDPKPHIVKKGGVYAVGGHYYCNATAVLEWWDAYLRGHAPLTTHRIGRVLRNLEVGPARQINGAICRDLNVETILQHARDTGVGDPEKMRAFIDRSGHVRADGSLSDTFATEA